MNVKMFSNINVGAGFAYFNAKMQCTVSGAVASYYCDVTIEGNQLLIWTTTLGIPYCVPYKGIANFKDLLYYMDTIKDLPWLDNEDMEIITKYLYQKITENNTLEERYVQEKSTSE